MVTTFDDAVAAIHDLPTFRGEISLDPIRACLADLDDPHRTFPAVHVAGTNGKGSTATLTANALSAAGYRTGLFTSPHLVDFRERVRVDGDTIPRGAVVDHAADVLATDADISFFEAMTAIAFAHFAARDVDIAVVETGMGGRDDATNVVDPAASVITNIAREHTDWLGDTERQIARDIAGIIADAPVVTGATGAPRDVIGEVAASNDATVHDAADRTELLSNGFDLSVAVDGTRIDTNLGGTYQLDNIDVVLAALDASPFDVPRGAVHEALRTTNLPGRMEMISRDPRTVLDGAHNPAAIARLAETFEGIDGPVAAAVSIMADKEYDRMLSTLATFVDHLVLSAAEIDRAADPAALADAAPVTPEIVPDPAEALDRAQERAGPDGTALATGSLYFVGDIKQSLE